MDEKLVLFKSPVVVGLGGALPKGVNNLIWGFVGFQSKTAKAIEHERENVRYVLPDYFPTSLKTRAKWKLRFIISRAFEKLRTERKITQRRDEFTKLRPWLRRFLLQYDHSYGGLFPKNGKNQKFIEEQMAELKMKLVEYRPNPRFSLTTLEW